MYERFDSYSTTRPRLRKIIGWTLVVVGFLALVTPLTPGGVLFFLGLELLGIRTVGAEKFKRFVRRAKETIPAEVEERVS